MNLIRDYWNESNYIEFIDYLFTLQDEKYKLFHLKLLKSEKIENIGIRTPILKRIAKEISKGNYLSFINFIKHKYYEEDVIYGFILGYIKGNLYDKEELIDNFLPYINNWATNDLVCANMNIFKNEHEVGLLLIKKYLNSKNSWTVRFGIVLLLDFYINDNYIDEVLNISKNIKHTDYYVLMALAWLISICYIKYPEKTLILLNGGYLDNFTHNKAIQKIIESKRISLNKKEALRRLKRSKNEK